MNIFAGKFSGRKLYLNCFEAFSLVLNIYLNEAIMSELNSGSK